LSLPVTLGSFSKLIGGVIFIGWIFYGLGAAAIFPIRRASQGKPIPYRVPGYPWTPLVFVLAAAAIVGNAIFLAFRDPDQFKNLTAAIVIMLLGLPRLLLLAQTRQLLNLRRHPQFLSSGSVPDHATYLDLALSSL